MPLTCQKHRFSLPDTGAYLNCAYMSPLSRRVVDAGVEALKRKCVPSRIQPRDFFEGPDRVRELFAQLVNAPSPDRVAMVPSVSYGMAIVARNTPLAAGQNVVTVHHQFPSNMYPWRRACADAGAEVRVVLPPGDGPGRGAAWNEAVLEAIDADTAMVALGNVHWTDGTLFDLEAVGRRAREVGAALVIDGTQSVGALPIDVERLQPDALVCAAYKWLMGPYSVGAAYLGPRYLDGVPLEETWIGRLGSERFGGLVDYEDRYRPGALRFDVGEASNFALVPMFAAALEQTLEWGVAAIQEYARGLTAPLADLRDRGFSVEDDAWRAGHLVGLRVPPGRDVEALEASLDARQISVSIRGGVIRVSPHVYNDAADIAALIDVLRA